MRESNKDRIWLNLKLHNWSLLHNYSAASLGRIWLVFNPIVVSITLEKCTDQLVHCSGFNFSWTIIYGANQVSSRAALWFDL